MTDKVHKLAIVKGEEGNPLPNEDIIKTCREMLRDAKSGRLQGLFIAVAIHDPKNPITKQGTEHFFKCSHEWGHAVHVAARNALFHLEYEVMQGGTDTIDPPLTDEDE